MMLMHICCGPCAVYPGEYLESQGIKFDAFFYNPNIHPIEEFEKRLDNAKVWAKTSNTKLYISNDLELDPWLEKENDKKSRCNMCYDIRIKKVFEYAKENGYCEVTSSLLVSPYQNHEMIIEIFNKYSEIMDIKFYYHDFREGYRKGQEKAKDMELYRQKYCGCLPSIKESSYMKKNIQNG